MGHAYLGGGFTAIVIVFMAVRQSPWEDRGPIACSAVPTGGPQAPRKTRSSRGWAVTESGAGWGHSGARKKALKWPRGLAATAVLLWAGFGSSQDCGLEGERSMGGHRGERVGEARVPGPYSEGGSAGSGAAWEKVGHERWVKAGGDRVAVRMAWGGGTRAKLEGDAVGDNMPTKEVGKAAMGFVQMESDDFPRVGGAEDGSGSGGGGSSRRGEAEGVAGRGGIR